VHEVAFEEKLDPTAVFEDSQYHTGGVLNGIDNFIACN
jgi:hypothetical protein